MTVRVPLFGERAPAAHAERGGHHGKAGRIFENYMFRVSNDDGVDDPELYKLWLL